MRTCFVHRFQVSPALRGCGAPAPIARAPETAVQRSAVIAHAKGKSRMRQGGPRQQMSRPPTPPVDPDNAEFVVFVRATKLPRWIPFTIVKGGAQANLLVKAMDGNFGKQFYKTTLINNIAQAVYKDKEKIIRSIKDNMPGYKTFTEYEFGFKVRDKDRPEAWIDADEVVILPEQEEVPEGPLDGLKQSVGSLFNRS